MDGTIEVHMDTYVLSKYSAISGQLDFDLNKSIEQKRHSLFKLGFKQIMMNKTLL